MDRDVEVELIRLRAEMDALRRSQAWPAALSVLALLVVLLVAVAVLFTSTIAP